MTAGDQGVDRTVALLTGATDGLGRAVAGRLAAEGFDLHVHGRDEAKLARTVTELREATGNESVHPHRADFAWLAAVGGLADELNGELERLDLLINNAGIGAGTPENFGREVSADGHELRFAVNYLAGFMLTLRLLPLLRRSAPARIVNVASLGQAPIDFADVMIERDYNGYQAYSQSKLAQVMFSNELAERLDPGEVTVTSLHPSTFMPTKMVLDAGVEPRSSLEDGVEATLRLATAPELDGVTGRFFDRQSEAAAHAQACDPEARRALWELSLELTGEPDPL
jgi:NAD(P)-dependent dehydrogenase (short-subunit alcohol dehydrogenase family)